MQKGYVCNPAPCNYENGKYEVIIVDDSVILCDEIVETTKSPLTKTVPETTIPKNVNKEKVILK